MTVNRAFLNMGPINNIWAWVETDENGDEDIIRTVDGINLMCRTELKAIELTSTAGSSIKTGHTMALRHFVRI
jgi:hypothetical protein